MKLHISEPRTLSKGIGILFTSLGLIMAGCSDSDTGTSPVDQGKDAVEKQIVYSLKETGGTEPEYLIAQDDIMSQTLSAQGAGNEQLGWNFYYPVGNTIFATGYENFETQAYTVDETGNLVKLGAFVFEQPLEVFGRIGSATFLATDTPRDGTHTSRELYIVDAQTGKITRKVNYSIDDVDTGTPGNGTVGWPTALVVRGDQLFIPFHKLDDSGAFTTPSPDEAFVAVYDWPLVDNAAPNKIISDTRTSHIGVNGASNPLIQLDNGDLYSFSMGASSGGFNPASSKPSGILRIAAGTDEFDSSYFFNIDEAANGGKIFWMDNLGNGKALARIVTSEDDAYFFSAYGKEFFNHKLVLVDLEAQTLTNIAGVPLHQKRYTSPLTISEGFAYLSIETADDAHIYQIDIETGTAVKGGEILGKTVKGVYFLNKAQ